MRLRLLAFAAFCAMVALDAGAQEAPLSVALDQARIVRIDAPAETIVIGNPSIVDVAIHDATTLILTGRSYGVTNLVVLDAAGEPVVDENVVVGSAEIASVRVYRQASRSTYSCAPSCEPTVTVGDNDRAFSSASGQFLTRESSARSSAQQSGEPGSF